MGAIYTKLNEEPIEIEYVSDPDDSSEEWQPSFLFDDKRWLLRDFVRTHNNPWGGINDCPEYIHGYYAHDCWNPYFIGLVGGDEAVDVYSYRWEEDES